MNPSPKKWPSIRNEQRVEIGLVQVDIGGRSAPYDHRPGLALKRAKDVLKDALLKSAECRGGKLSSWEDDGGTFMFPIEGPDSFNNCCLAAIEMLEQMPSVKQEVQLPAELECLMMIRIVCDTGMVASDPEVDNLPGEFVDNLKQHEQVVSAENKVTITERIFRQLLPPLKSRFVKWKHSSELGIALYAASDISVKVGRTLADLSSERGTPAEDQPARDALMPTPGGKHSLMQGWLAVMSEALKSRKMLSVGAVVLLALVIFGFIRFLAGPTSPSPVPLPQPPLWTELVQSEEWRIWRKQIHEKLSAGKVTENMLVEALKITPPAHPEQAPAALRRDQAIADVLMTYPEVREILEKRFGIYADRFLGTGLSKPNNTSSYGAASVHEYLIPNLPDDDPAVWMRIVDPNKNPMDMRMTVQELFENDEKPLVKAIVERAKGRDMANPVMIRFARLDLSKYKYSRKLGRPNAHRVFASNLAEVWDTPIGDAANLSGHKFTTGDKVYVWAFLPNYPLPNQPGEVVAATWGEVLSNLPKWLSEAVDNNR